MCVCVCLSLSLNQKYKSDSKKSEPGSGVICLLWSVEVLTIKRSEVSVTNWKSSI